MRMVTMEGEKCPDILQKIIQMSRIARYSWSSLCNISLISIFTITLQPLRNSQKYL